MSTLVHGTALVVGTYGLILIGTSGAGKSSMALRLIDQARRAGHFATLLSDDQVFLKASNGHVIATAPPTIKGLIEVRGSGIGSMEPIETMVVHQALSLVISDASTRIPEENQTWSPHEGINLPLLFIDRSIADPFFRLSVLISGFPVR
jgi:serine kinase of HPr protein (carbohydrate metabolism regulator)